MPWDPVGRIVGDAGVSVTLLPSVANAAALPASGNNPGDARMTVDDGHLHSWDGSQWTDVGQFQGPEGPAGSDAPATTVAAGNGVAVTGDPSSGYTVAAQVDPAADNVLALSAAGLNVDPASLISTAQAGNLIVQGSDDLLYVSDDIGISSIVQSGSVNLSGTGAAASPLSATIVLSGDTNNQAAIGSDNGLFVPEVSVDAADLISTDANNILVQGGDNLLFVPTPADPTLVAGNGIAVAGLTISAALSTDANNAAVFGSDNGLFVPDPAAPDPTTFISADANNTLVQGTDDLLFVPAPTLPPLNVTGTTTINLSGDGTSSSPLTADFLGIVANDTGTIALPGNGLTATPLTANIIFSADANNVATTGSDGGLFVPESAAPDAASLISSDPGGNQIGLGNDSLLFVAAAMPLAGGQDAIDAAYSIAAADAGGLLRASTVGIDIEIPDPSGLITDNFIVGILNTTSGAVTATPAAGVNILASTPGTNPSAVGGTITLEAGAFMWLRKVDDTIWDAWGNGISWT